MFPYGGKYRLSMADRWGQSLRRLSPTQPFSRQKPVCSPLTHQTREPVTRRALGSMAGDSLWLPDQVSSLEALWCLPGRRIATSGPSCFVDPPREAVVGIRITIPPPPWEPYI